MIKLMTLAATQPVIGTAHDHLPRSLKTGYNIEMIGGDIGGGGATGRGGDIALN